MSELDIIAPARRARCEDSRGEVLSKLSSPANADAFCALLFAFLELGMSQPRASPLSRVH